MYTRCDRAEGNGTSFYSYVDLERLDLRERFTALFGPPEYGLEPERGYNWEYRFRGPDGETVTLYDRWGTWRIGSWSGEQGERFRAWLLAQL